VAVDAEPEDLARVKEAGTTLSHGIRTRREGAADQPPDESEG
jgi:hypothetical protein